MDEFVKAGLSLFITLEHSCAIQDFFTSLVDVICDCISSFLVLHGCAVGGCELCNHAKMLVERMSVLADCFEVKRCCSCQDVFDLSALFGKASGKDEQPHCLNDAN